MEQVSNTQRSFIMKNMPKFLEKWSLGWLGVYMYKNSDTKHPIINFIMKNILRNPCLIPSDATFDRQYEATIKDTLYWHGTGIFQYSRDGSNKVNDIFSQIIIDGSLNPKHDLFDISKGNMYSISCSTIRTYARIYADMHQYGGVANNKRYGAAYFWAYYFMVSAALMAVKYMNLWANVFKRHAVARNVKDSMKKIWINKVSRRKYISVKDFFVKCSDIKGNYGILIGIKNMDQIAENSPYITMYETRSSAPICIEYWSHLEVPRDFVLSVKSKLTNDGIDIPVYAIEDCESYWSNRSFSSLVKSSIYKTL